MLYFYILLHLPSALQHEEPTTAATGISYLKMTNYFQHIPEVPVGSSASFSWITAKK